MDSDNILFSIVVPAYNRKKHVQELISRVIKFNYPHWELLVVDDGSTDDTASLFSAELPANVIYIKQENNERGAARNKGVEFANGDYVTFLDSDDYLLPHALDVACDIIKGNQDIPIFHIGFDIRNSNGKVLHEAERLPFMLNDLFVEKNPVACLGMFLRKDIALAFKFNEQRDLSGTEDYELWLRIAAEMPILHFDKTSAVLVHHSSRSMLDTNIEKTIARIEAFVFLICNNPSTKKFIGARMNAFLSYRYSYISLHAALAKSKLISVHYLLKSFAKYPLIILKTRFYVVLKKIVLG